MADVTKLILIDRIEPLIHDVRGQKVMLDSDLAKLFGVETKALNRVVKRNLARFPSDFLMQLTAEETDSLRYQFGTLKTGRGQHRKYLPYAFTEHGAFMAASLLNSPRAVEVSVFAVRRASLPIRLHRPGHQSAGDAPIVENRIRDQVNFHHAHRRDHRREVSCENSRSGGSAIPLEIPDARGLRTGRRETGAGVVLYDSRPHFID